MTLKSLKFAVLALLAAGTLASCSEENDTPDFIIDPVDHRVLVINQGNQAAAIPGSIDVYQPADGTIVSNVFSAVNRFELGHSPQNGVVCRDRLFVALYDDNCLQVTDRHTLESRGRVAATQPECVATDGRYVYAACNNGYLERIDPATFDTALVYVGPNPMGVAVEGDAAYVSISDAWWGSDYSHGRKLACVDLATFTVTREIAVGTNPTTVVNDGRGQLYVACQGNYADIAPEVWKVDIATGRAQAFVPGSYIATRDGKLYTITGTYDANWNATYSYAAYEADGTPLQGFALSELPPQPTGIAVSPADGRLYITSDGSNSYDAYTLPGRLYVYTSTGTLLSRKDVGIHPFSVVFPD